MKRVIATASAAAMYNPVSQATLAPNGLLYTAGMIGRSPKTGRMLELYPGALVMFTAVACVGAA